MARVRSVEFLPEIFQTPVNQQFLASTLDQLVQEPKFIKTQGYIGRKIGPGVNANDKYVIEPSTERNEYQLEPGIVFCREDTDQAEDAITYSGMLDSIRLAGGIVSRADRLTKSQYYNWDPFVDYDKLVNFSEYYWLPAGPDSVTVTASSRPAQSNIKVTRNSGYYTFDVEQGSNPTLTLVRGYNYTFNVTQNLKTDYQYRVTNRGSTAYVIDYQVNPKLTLVRGNTYQFNISTAGDFPFYIKTQPTTGLTNIWSRGVTNNGATSGIVSFTVPYDAPNRLYYAAENSQQMQGEFEVVNPSSGTGPGFWIQTDPGVDGRVTATPNISSRDVLGVVNNGEDFGAVTFNVPLKTAQNFYYTLEEIPAVDMICDLKFNQVNGAFVDDFLATYGGIDGITDLNTKTIVFPAQDPVNDVNDAIEYGWTVDLGYGPFPTNNPEYVGQPGSYDVPDYATQTPIIPKAERYVVWQIIFQQDLYGSTYMQLVKVREISKYQKFSVRSGTEYASTNWFKNAEEYIERIPLLSAVLDTLFYQDGANPGMFGQIRLIDQADSARLFIDDIIGKKQYTSPNGIVFTNGLKVQFRDEVFPASYQNNVYFVEGVGTAIRLLPVTGFISPEPFTRGALIPFDSLPFDVGNYDADQNQPLQLDYITINRASSDLNAWSRSNRWFHRQVLEQTAVYNGTVALLDQNYRAKRPIVEFRAGLKLFEFGTLGKPAVNIIDFQTTDALSTINGLPAYNIDGYILTNGSRVIFAADTDPDVRNRIYEVELITPDTQPPLITQPVINLVPAEDSEPQINDVTVCLSGLTLQGRSFYFDGITWADAQLKSKINQPPLFDVFDSDGISLSDIVKYPSSTFSGSKLFSYATGTGANDPNLGFAIKYLTINNVGDIVFENNFYTDTFLYVVNRASVTENVSIGFVRDYADRTDFTRLLGWQTSRSPSRPYQQFRFTYDGSPLLLDVRVIDQESDTLIDAPMPVLKVFAGATFVPQTEYTYTRTDNTTTIRLLNTYPTGDVIEVMALSDQVSSVAFYDIPVNLENNALNTNSNEFTLGTIRTHYNSIAQNLIDFRGPINGSNNSRDLGNIVPYGSVILQQSSPMTLPGLFLRNPEYNVFEAIAYNSDEYQKYKDMLMDAVATIDIDNLTVPQILTQAITLMTEGRNSLSPFYWSDMLPAGALFETTTYTYTAISTPTFDTIQSYDFTSSNYRAINVYVNQQLLIRGPEYQVNPDEFNLTVLIPLSVGDVITIEEFASTVGNFVPNTPTKMGLYPAYIPSIYVDDTYVTPTTIILGHDGSKTVAWGDIRDQVLLEFETRIFNNLKEVTPTPIPPQSVLPNFFRTTDYTAEETQEILNTSFLNWTGLNRLEYTEQEYNPSNPFTWNYSQAGNKLDGSPLQGAWRGIYLNFYGTITPHLTPWEMVGFSEEPDWWETRYGSAPYTSGNRVLWDDLEAGRIADPTNDRIDPLFARPGLTQILPVDDQGNLLSPMQSVVGAYNPVGFQASWKTGDYGPVEYSWRVSSAFPFALMRLEALTDPATFFNLYADRDLYRYDEDIGQFLYNQRYRLDANTIEVYGLGQSKASYINWIVDWSAANGNNTAPQDIKSKLASIDVRLCYRMAGFSDKQYLKLFLEKPTPASTNTSLMLPDESFDLLLYKNQTSEEVFYSSVVVQRVADGWKVFGYSENQPYFPILVSRPLGVLREISSGGTSVRVATQYTDEVVLVPYGYVFTNRTVLSDFLLSYGALLARQGVVFDDYENGFILNWDQMVQEFLYWSQQGWGVSSIIVLNPSANKFKVIKEQLVANDVSAISPFEQILDQNRVGIPYKDLLVRRDGNDFSIEAPGSQAISFIKLGFSSYEHLMVLRNQSVFGDLIYNPGTGARQYRIALIGSITSDWNGQVDAQGFIINSDNVTEWQSNRRYTKGEIVKYKNNLWSALTIVQPKAQFDFNDWVISDYNLIQKGLLPNLPNKADQLANSYDVSNANLESDNDLLAYGLTGFRPRTYMAALDLNDVSQVNVYSQFLKSKGTIRSVDLLSNANFGKESADYQIYENWALLSGTYGAQANRRFVDLQLNAALLNPNPSIVQLIATGEQSLADQTFNIDNLWSQSAVITNPNIFPIASNVEPQLPTAGYVNIDDVDITVYSLDDPSVLNPYLDQLGVGTTLWVAKVNSYDWNIYRCSVVPAQVIAAFDNLDQTSTITFNQQHGLAVGQLLVIKNFNSEINGVYRVLTVPSLYEVSIEYTFPNDQQIEADGNGLAFKLQTVRVSQPSNIANLPFANAIRSGAKVWVDNNSQGRWTVLEKRAPVVLDSEIQPVSVDLVVEPNTRFAYSISQRADNLIALVGRPDVNGERGQVINYLQVTNDPNSPRYAPARILNLRDADNVINYGFSTSLGKNTWAASGAPLSGNGIGYVGISRFKDVTQAFLETQLLLALDQPGPCEFGYSVSMSSDERWLYVGAPAYNRVYAYGRQDVQDQVLTYQVTQPTTIFATTGIQFTNDRQLDVFLNGTLKYLGYDYIVSGGSVVFLIPVRANDTVVIARATARALNVEVFPYIRPTITTGAGYGAEFTVSLVRGKYTATILSSGQNYSIGEVLTIPGTWFGGTSPLNDCFIEVTQLEGPGLIKGISVTGQFIPLTGLPLKFDVSDLIYPVDDIGSVSVYVDGKLQRPKIDYEYYLSDDSSLTPDSSATTGIAVIDFSGRPPGFGANITIETGSYYRYVDMLTVPGLPLDARFGETVACGTDGRAVVIGAPNVDVNGVDRAGMIYVFDRHVERMMVTNTSVTTYTPNAALVAPTSVKVNATYLNNTFYYNTTGFTENNSSVTITAPLNIGDEIDIETNQFVLLQSIAANEVQEKSAFGHVVDLCPNNCSIYTGQPDYSLVDVPQSGSVQRNINQSRLYGVISSTNDTPVLNNGDTIRVNNYEIEVPNVAGYLRLAGLAEAIRNTVPNVTAEVNSDNIITINVINFDATVPGNRLSVLPGAIGTAFDDLGFVTFTYSQTITNPVPVSKSMFGHTVRIDSSASILTIAAPSGDSIDPDTFDAYSTPYPYSTFNSYYVLDPNSTPRTPTTWDGNSTTFFDITYRSGVVYTYDRLAAYNGSITNPDKFVLGQQIRADSLSSYDQFGTSLSYVNNVFLIGAPGTDLGDSASDDGSFYVFDNPNNSPAWQVNYQQPDTVDVYLFNSISMYDRLKSTTNQFFDFFNPILGKMLGAVQSNLDYISPNDPASYNQGLINVDGNTWAATYEGRIWWDIADVRFIDPSAGDIKYAALRWGQIFPGSSVNVYQWTRSNVPPAQYVGPGSPYSLTSYTTWTEVNNEGIIETVYYFWVQNSNIVAKNFGKTLSTEIITRYIIDPRSSGISYVAPLSPSALAIYNGNQYINASDTILHVEYDQRGNNDNVHQEYELLTEDQPQSFLNDRLYLKMIDSFSGQNAFGAAVPDTTLSPAMRYGPEFNPRQSMFVNRYLALQNYITRANSVMAQYPVTESRRLVILNSADPEPSAISGAWNKRVLNLEQLGWEDISIVPLGYRYLVVTDSSNANLWTIYTVSLANDGITRELVLTRVQSWDVRKYWDYVDWYDVGYNSSVQPIAEVPIYADLSTLTVPVGSSVKVTSNSQGKWEIYLYNTTGWQRVGLQDGTIAISPVIYDYALGRFGFDGEVFDAQYFDQTPQIETRKIIQGLNEEIFIDDLAIERNRLMILMFNYILSEQEAPTWLLKTSLIDVTHRIRELLPYQTYRRDNQDFVLQYINEVKPYHTQIRQFNLQYSGNDEFQGALTDYDLPAYYDTSLTPPQYISPILIDLPVTAESGIQPLDEAADLALNNPAIVGPNAAIWLEWPYSQWFNNYLLELNSIEVINSGAGYSFPPQVTIRGVAKRLGTAEAVINTAGQVVAINIIDPGEGYYLTPTVELSSVSGTSATAMARMTNDLVRTFTTTLKYDRYQYRPNWEPWVPNDTYDNGTLVYYDDRVWQANSPDSTGVNTPTFEPSDWILVPAGDLSGVDRTMAYYVSTVNTPGKELPLLIDGVDYPGVQIQGVAFDAATGFDSDPYDSYVYDNIQTSPEGLPTYSDRILDTIYNAGFFNDYIGTRATDVNVEGGAFIDTYSSYAPEELVPGSEFDTLDFRVYTTPGADWRFDGHGFPIANRRYEVDITDPTFNFAGLLDYPVAIGVTNVTTRRDLNEYTDFIVDWPTQTVTLIQNVNDGDVLMVRVYGLGGGNQLWKLNTLGGTIGDSLEIPVQYSLIQELAIFVNGDVFTDFTYSQLPLRKTLITFNQVLTDNDYVSITAIGVSPGTVPRSWSKPMSQYVVVTDPAQTTYALTNYILGTNAPNIIVLKNGVRARPAQGIQYIADGSSEYFLPTRGGISQGLISDPDVNVWVDNVLQFQFSQYLVEPWDGSSLRTIRFLTNPPLGAKILISVATKADYTISTSPAEITFRITSSFGLSAGDVLQFITWNDTSEQDIETRLWVGPVTSGTTLVEPYDSTPFSSGDILNGPGSFDYSTGTTTTANDIDLRRSGIDPTRLWVTLNGNRLVYGIGYNLEEEFGTTFLILPSIMSVSDVLVVELFTSSVVPGAMAFRIFQDMRGIQATYRITPSTTTALSQILYADDDVVHLVDASAVGEPNIELGYWGVITVGAERIMYRYRDLENNTVYSLMRGTAGTGINTHPVGTVVYDMSRGNMLPAPYQDYVVVTTTPSDGNTSVFVAPNISIVYDDSTTAPEEVIRVTVGGTTLVQTEYTVQNVNPVTVNLQTIPPVGVDVSISVLRGVTWYQPGIDTASDGRPLQETNTEAAKFLRGL